MNKPNMKEQQLIDREREDEIVKGLKQYDMSEEQARKKARIQILKEKKAEM